LEFVALVALRVREPSLARPFRVPGGMVMAVMLGIFPSLLIGLAVFDQAGKWESDETGAIAPAPALLLAAALAAFGPGLFFASQWIRRFKRR
jgi:hypothetical protein